MARQQYKSTIVDYPDVCPLALLDLFVAESRHAPSTVRQPLFY
jgi:hypothetical protein